jgi:hypothetical protein
MTTVTVNLTTILVSAVAVGASVTAWAVRQARRQTRLAERMNWLIARYARDHDHAVPWDEPITDGGFPHEAEPDGDASAPHHFYIGVGAAVFGFASVWQYYPATGAGMVAVGILIAADDAVSHIFGWWTPLDAVWRRVIRPAMRWYGD